MGQISKEGNKSNMHRYQEKCCLFICTIECQKLSMREFRNLLHCLNSLGSRKEDLGSH